MGVKHFRHWGLEPGSSGLMSKTLCGWVGACVRVCVSLTLTSELLELSLQDFNATYLANALGDFKTNYTFYISKRVSINPTKKIKY